MLKQVQHDAVARVMPDYYYLLTLKLPIQPLRDRFPHLLPRIPADDHADMAAIGGDGVAALDEFGKW